MNNYARMNQFSSVLIKVGNLGNLWHYNAKLTE